LRRILYSPQESEEDISVPGFAIWTVVLAWEELRALEELLDLQREFPSIVVLQWHAALAIEG
jgi:hypothetical protein